MFVLVLSYFLGAIPAGYLLDRLSQPLLPPLLVRIPFSPSLRLFAQRLFPRILSSVADLSKGATVILLVPYLANVIATTPWAWLNYPLVSPGLRSSATLVFMVLAHVLSVYFCGWGGRGVATALGACLVLTPLPALASGALWFLVFLIFRSLRLSALAASFALPLFIILFQPLDRLFALAAFLLALLAIITHTNSSLAHYPSPSSS
ncbi:MAG: glycerol-3-phosphate acyltransferase [bacterium]|nr:glycerol-3-phosphate acyltransferase [bacterium]